MGISANVALLFPGLLCIMKPTTILVRLLILCATYTLQCISAKPSPTRPNSTAATTQFSTNETAAIYNRSIIETAGGFCDGGYCSVSLLAFPSHTRRITIPSISWPQPTVHHSPLQALCLLISVAPLLPSLLDIVSYYFSASLESVSILPLLCLLLLLRPTIF